MSWYWRLKSIPELQDLSPSSQYQAFESALERAKKQHPDSILFLSQWLVPSIVIGVLHAFVLVPTFYRNDLHIGYCIAASILTLTLTAISWTTLTRPLVIHRVRPYLHDSIAAST